MPSTSAIFGHRPGGFETEIADDDVGFVDEDARPFLQFREADPWIDVAIIIRPADHDLRGVARRAAQKSPDPIRGRGDLFDHLLELLDHLAGVADHFLLGGDLAPEREEPFAGKIVHREGGNRAIKGLEQADLLLVVVRRTVWCRIFFPFVAHFPVFPRADLFKMIRMQDSGRNRGDQCGPFLSSVVETAFGLIAFTIFLFQIVTGAPRGTVVGREKSDCGGRRGVLRLVPLFRGVLAQLVRAPPCHGGGCGFEPRRLRVFLLQKVANSLGPSKGPSVP